MAKGKKSDNGRIVPTIMSSEEMLSIVAEKTKKDEKEKA